MRAVSAVVPAAGLSTRMGGPNKLLLPYEDTTVVGAVVRTLVPLVANVIVVTGRDAEEVSTAAQPAQTVFNPEYRSGLGRSIAVGASHVPDGDHILVALGDMPAIEPSTIGQLLLAIEPDKIVVPVYSDEPGRHGHPVLFGANYRDELLALKGDKGAKPVIDAHGELVVKIEVPGRLLDLDQPFEFKGRPVE